MIVGIRYPADEFLKEGVDLQASIEICSLLANSGAIDYISIVGGQPLNDRLTALVWPTSFLPPAAYLPLASAIKQNCDIPIFHATRITDPATANRAIEEGHIDMVGMTRALIADPHMIQKIKDGQEDDIRQCVGNGYCLDRVMLGGEALCVHNISTSREKEFPHLIARSEGAKKKAVVVGGGPGGMEAARVLASRGHDVVLFEKSDRLGGQINLLAKVPWRESNSGITRWLEGQLTKLNVDIRFDTEAGEVAIQGENPDVVIIATGGTPNKGAFKGHELAVSGWDILSGEVAPARNALVFDSHGAHDGPSTAQFMLARDTELLEIVTPHKVIMSELGSCSIGAYQVDLHNNDAVTTTDTELVEIYREGDKLVAVLNDIFSQKEEERLVDQVVSIQGTLANESLYQQLTTSATNLGQPDIHALRQNKPQREFLNANPEGQFLLYRIGDAWAGRNIHAAMLDANRICRDL